MEREVYFTIKRETDGQDNIRQMENVRQYMQRVGKKFKRSYRNNLLI